MSTDRFASTPAPPYFAVIFTSMRTDGDDEAYGEAADRMVSLASVQPGFLGVDSVRGADGLGITVSYWQSEAAIREWKLHLDHAAVRERGRQAWYGHYELRVAKVERAYAGPPAKAKP